jgi:hypothetical protein
VLVTILKIKLTEFTKSGGRGLQVITRATVGGQVSIFHQEMSRDRQSQEKSAFSVLCCLSFCKKPTLIICN